MLHRAQQGDPEAWNRLAQLYGPIVYGWARRLGCQPPDAADVMQETFLAVAVAIGRFDHQRPGATFRGWIWTITRNKIHDLWRRGDADQPGVGGSTAKGRMEQFPQHPAAKPDDQPPSAATEDQTILRRQALALIRDQFEPRSWAMFWETTICGRDVADVASELGVSRWAVYKMRTRVLMRLREQLDGLV